MSQATATRPARVRSAPRPETKPEPRPEQKPERHLKVVDPAARRRAQRERLGVRLAVAVVVVAVLVIVAFRAFIAEGQLRLERLRNDITQEQTRYEKLRLEVGDASSPDQIISRAHALGLVKASSFRYAQATGASAAAPDLRDTGLDRIIRDSWSKAKPHLDAPK